jgi:DNA phosphorothioation-associated putative methyltransferase
MDTLGKTVGQRRYFHRERIVDLTPPLSQLVDVARVVLESRVDPVFNIVRVDTALQEVAFLDYPQLGTVPFPALHSSWRVHVPSRLVTNRRYDKSLNPPILHRCELILPTTHPKHSVCIELTKQCDQLGLFDNPSIIGFQRTWLELIKQKGYALAEFDLVPVGNAIDNDADLAADSHDGEEIYRHRTALSRSTLSAPIQLLIRDGLLQGGVTLFDYGCGKGDDLATLQSAGFSVAGWDPHFRSTGAKTSADIVNLGFVINVIENKEERIDALQAAYALATKVLAVSAMLRDNESMRMQAFADGVVTSRRTFQKYYTQAELQQFIENVLDEDAYPVAPGIFYVFRDRSAEQHYLLSKSSNRSRVARARLAVIRHVRAPAPRKAPRLKREDTPEARACLERLWSLCLELGRVPDLDEIAAPQEAIELFGSIKRAIAACLATHDAASLDEAAEGRRDDILVMMALRAFERRRQQIISDPRLKRDIRRLFGSIQHADATAQTLLFSVNNKESIARACDEASSLGLGWLEPDKSLQLHTSLAERLPSVLRVYIGCAMALVGDLKSFDLVKIHIESGKVSMLLFDDFEGKPLPALVMRVKVRLHDQDLDIFSYGAAYKPTVLFHKSRYINEEFPLYAEQVDFEASFARLDLFDVSGYGPTEEELHNALHTLRWQIDGFRLIRSTSTPAISDPCGAHYTFAQLIQCGETWERLRIDNIPQSPATYNALVDLAKYILDPVIDYFGAIVLTYAFASRALTRHIKTRIEPAIDQHISCETGPSGALVCARQGAAIDFLVEYEDMREVAQWIASNCPFDRIYYYGADKPLHVSYGPERLGVVYELAITNGRRVPKKLQF